MSNSRGDLTELIDWIRHTSPQRIAVLTGAGVSAESGVPTFRGKSGLWKNYRPEELATPQAFTRNPMLVWSWYEWRRDIVRNASPNDAHVALAELEQETEGLITLITQNVDSLHRLAGSRNLVELHGNLFRVRCPAEGAITRAEDPFEELPPHCACGAMLRPDVVWFGEPLPEAALIQSAEAVAGSDLFLVIGTSGLVQPAAGLITLAQGKTAEINLEPTPLTEHCDFAVHMPAAAATRSVVDALLGRSA